jgi:hypothetical protein
MGEHSADTRDLLGGLRALGSKLARPVILSGMQKLMPSEFEKLLRVLEVIIVRWQVIGEGRTGTIERQLARLAELIWTGKATKRGEFVAALTDLYTSDQDFKAKFSTQEGLTNKKRRARQPFASGGARHFSQAPAAARGPRMTSARRRNRRVGPEARFRRVPQPRPAINTAAGVRAEHGFAMTRLPAFAIGRRPFGARAPSIFAPSGPAREAAELCATVIPGKRGVHAEHGFAMTPSVDPGPSGVSSWVPG